MGLLILFGVATLLLVSISMAGLVYVLQHPPRRTEGDALGQDWPLDPAGIDALFEDRWFELSDGERTSAWVVRGERPAGPVVVFSHGWSDSRWTSLARYGEMLLPLCSWIVFYDVRAHGDSKAKRSFGGTREVADLLHIIEQVKSETAQPVVAMGHSMGGGISLVAAAKDEGGLIAAVVAEGIYNDWLTPIRRLLWYWRWPPEPFASLAWVYEKLVLRQFHDFDRVTHAAKVKCPVLLLHAEDDFLCPIDHARRVAAVTRDVELVAFEQGDHMQVAEVNRAAYAEALRTFFARLGEAGKPGRDEREVKPAARDDAGDDKAVQRSKSGAEPGGTD